MRIKLLGIKLSYDLPKNCTLAEENDDFDLLIWHAESLETNIDNKIVLFNSDVNMPPKSKNVYLISYGVNSKATITASSISDGKMLVCLQRSVKNIYDQIIEPHEFVVNVATEEGDSELAAASLKLICIKQK